MPYQEDDLAIILVEIQDVIEQQRKEREQQEAQEQSKLLAALEKLHDHRRHAVAIRAQVESQQLTIKDGFHIATTILSKNRVTFDDTTKFRTYLSWGISDNHVTLDHSGVVDDYVYTNLNNWVFDPINHYPRR